MHTRFKLNFISFHSLRVCYFKINSRAQYFLHKMVFIESNGFLAVHAQLQESREMHLQRTILN